MESNHRLVLFKHALYRLSYPTRTSANYRHTGRFTRAKVSAQSHHSLSSAAFTTNIAESNFRYTQGLQKDFAPKLTG